MLVLTINISSLKAQKVTLNEDKLIVLGLLYDEYKSYEDSYQVYERLYKMTKEEAFLFRKVKASLFSQTHLLQSLNDIKKILVKKSKIIEARRLLVGLYLTLNEVDKAKKEAKTLLTLSSTPQDLSLGANAYLYGSEFKKSLALLKKLYEKVPKEEILLRMSMIMDIYTNQREEAIALLQTHLRLNVVVSHDVYLRLLLLYKKQNDTQGALEMYKLLFSKTQKKEYLLKLIELYRYEHNVEGAIEFLEKNTKNSEMLFELYKLQKHFAKAIKMSDVLYKNDHNAKWIAEKGLLMIEQSVKNHNKSIIPLALTHFEKAFTLGNDDSIYLNYYGYTLIDEEVNVKKGIKIIKDALLQQPKNTYYLDSLAWGYYKQKECNEAFKVMKEVVEKEGLKEKEIALHWSAIKECK